MASIIAKKEKTYKTPIFAIFFILFGSCLLAISIKEISTYTYKNDNYINAEAIVIKHTYKDGKVSTAVLEYNVDEDTYTVSSSNKSDCVKSYGSVVNIKYNSENPEEIIFPDRGINIVTPVLALVMLSIGLAIIIVMISDNIKRIKRISKVIESKTNQVENNDTNNNNNNITLNKVINRDYDTPNNSYNSTDNNNINLVNTDEKINVEEQNNDMQNNKDKIIEIPFVSNKPADDIINDNKSNKSNNVDYIQFISETNDNNDTPNFIPNIDILKEKQNDN